MPPREGTSGEALASCFRPGPGTWQHGTSLKMWALTAPGAKQPPWKDASPGAASLGLLRTVSELEVQVCTRLPVLLTGA